VSVDFAPETGRLRLDAASLEALLAYARDGTPMPGAVSRSLRETGAVTDGGAHARLRPALRTVGDPLCRLDVRTEHPDGEAVEVEGWVDGEAAVLLLPTADRRVEVVAIRPTFVPVAIARVTGVLPGRADARHSRWEVLVTRPRPDGRPTGRSLTVADTDDGLMVSAPDDEAGTVVPPTELWRLLTLLLPGDDELAAGPV
jgi:hypothetical protein